MSYKFIGGSDESVSQVLDFVLAGSLKFTSALHFNDPFEFKFHSVPPSRGAFDDWHRANDPGRSAEELANAWSSFSGPASDWNTAIAPRINLLQGMFVLCLTKRWDSHLMWAHYTGAHRGLVIDYDDAIVSELSVDDDYVGDGKVSYWEQPPELRWYQCSREEMLGPVLFTKSSEWAYEQEFRVVVADQPAPAVYKTIRPELVRGIILGARSPAKLRARALAAKQARPDLNVRQVSSAGGYQLQLIDVDPDVWVNTHVL